MPNDNAPTESRPSLPLHRILEDEYVTLHGPLPDGYPWSFLNSEIQAVNLILEFRRGATELSKHLKKKFAEYLEKLAAESPDEKAYPDSLKALGDQGPLPSPVAIFLEESTAVKDFLNALLLDEDLYTPKWFEGIQLREKTVEMARTNPQGKKLSLTNRRLLEEAYPEELKVRLPGYELAEVHDGLLQTTGDDDGATQRLAARRTNAYRDLHVSTIYSIIHERNKQRSALCLSGGGIRSATFNLGILQGLARHKLLGEFDYLSTVSGGGYIGSWLSAWRRRHRGGINGVTKELSRRPSSPLTPEPKEVMHLRTYSNYLSPQTGLLSADTWTLIAIYIRNLFLNWLVFIPLLLAVLMIPRMGVAAILQSQSPRWDWLEPLTLIGGLVTATISIGYAGLFLPREDGRGSTQTRFFIYCLAPLIISCILLTYFWALYNDGSQWQGWDYISNRLPGWPNWTLKRVFMFYATVLIFLGWLFYVIIRRKKIGSFIQRARVEGRDVRLRVALTLTGAFFVVITVGLLTGYALYWAATAPEWVHHPNRSASLFACLAAPLLLALFSFGASVVVGIVSRGIADEDLEWLGRFAGWVLIIIVFWIGLNVLVLYGPNMMLMPFSDRNQEVGLWSKVWGGIVTFGGVIAGLITIIGGFSSKTPAGKPEHEQPSKQKRFKHKLLRLAAPTFLVFLIVLLSSVTDLLLVNFSKWIESARPFEYLPFSSYWRLTDVHSVATLQWYDHVHIVGTSNFDLLLLFTALLAALCFVMGRTIDTGKFSIHSLYGNRLERAYLGASRKGRKPNWFTDFDPRDDVQMHELRPALFREDSFKNVESFVEKLRNGHDHLSKHIYDNLSPTTRQLIESDVSSGSPSRELKVSLSGDLNKLLDSECLYMEEYQPEPTGRIAQLLKQTHQGESLVLLNRWVLEEAYPDELEGSCSNRPLHVVNMALNLMKGDNLAWQERKAEPFTVSPLHSGNHLLGYRRTRYYGGQEGISLGTAFTISGAAASPNMGYMTSSPLVSFLMALFNVRLGWWLGNPGKAGDNTFDRSVPKFAIGPIFSEAFSMTDDKRRYVYLSDGGHFDNLGLYEMVLRRCRLIVVSDATTDPDYEFDSLGMAIRKIRIDLGVPIEFKDKDFNMHTRPPRTEGKYCAIGSIRYSCVDENDPNDDGVLIYIKASLSGREPQDVLHYYQENKKFPQEFIGDQFFSESQFESYRALGSHIMDVLCASDKGSLSLTAFENAVRAYHRG